MRAGSGEQNCAGGIRPEGLEGGRGVGGAAAEVALALMEVTERLIERGGIEVGPEHGGKPELGVGALPEQEVREPLFAAGTYEQVGGRGGDAGVGSAAGGGEQLSEALGGDGLGAQIAIEDGLGGAAGGLGDGPPRATVEGEAEKQSIGGGGAALDPFEHDAGGARQAVAAPDGGEAYMLAAQVVLFGEQELAQQL